VIEADFAWNDVGSRSAVWEAQARGDGGNATRGPAILDDVADCLVFSDGPQITACGVSGLSSSRPPSMYWWCQNIATKASRNWPSVRLIIGRTTPRRSRQVCRADRGDRPNEDLTSALIWLAIAHPPEQIGRSLSPMSGNSAPRRAGGTRLAIRNYKKFRVPIRGSIRHG
jgi:hypothetical protein